MRKTYREGVERAFSCFVDSGWVDRWRGGGIICLYCRSRVGRRGKKTKSVEAKKGKGK